MIKGIPYWRHVQYTDDGCSEYQCLNCHLGWECRSYVDSDHGCRGWEFCPYCGCKWIGQRPQSYERGGKHNFVAHSHGREMPYKQTEYRYDVLEWMEYAKRWESIADYYKTHNEFYLTPGKDDRHHTSVLARKYIREALDARNKHREECSWMDIELGQIKVVLERRELHWVENYGSRYQDSRWVVVKEIPLNTQKT